MSAPLQQRGRPRPGAAVGARASRAWPDLARREGHRLLRHPALVVGAALSAVLCVVATGVDFATLALSGFALLPLTLGTALAANLAALRGRRHGTEELFDSLPTSSRARTAGHLLSVGWAVALGVVLLAVAAAVVAARAGPEVRFPDGVVRQRGMLLVELAQGPLAVAAYGLIGAALGRRVRTHALAPALVVAPLVLSRFGLPWLTPVANHSRAVAGGYWPHPEIAPRTELVGFDVTALTWHLVYLATVAALAVAVALWSRRPAPSVAVGAALAAAVVAGWQQVP